MNVTIQMKDEVTCTLTGLQSNHLKSLVDDYAEFVPGFKYMPLYTMGAWDGRTNFVSKKGKTYQTLLTSIIPRLIRWGYELNVVDQRPPIDITVPHIDKDIFKEHGWTLRPHQVDAVNSVIDNDHKGVLIAATGAGKAQPLTAKILTPTGWTTMGQLQVGDAIVAGDGSSTKVVGVFPQGIKPIYKISFHDGSSTSACGEHLWQVAAPIVDHTAKTAEKIMSTMDLIKFLHRKNDGVHTPGNITIPLCNPVQGPDKVLPITPYLLGALLGDGGFTQAAQITFTNTDQDVITRVNTDLSLIGNQLRTTDGLNHRCVQIEKQWTVTQTEASPAQQQVWKSEFCNKVVYTQNPLVTVLQNMGLLGAYSNDKFIPGEYMHGSIEQRLQLMQGLMDTDGTVDKRGHVSFTSVSKQLALDVQALAWSLGGVCTITTRTPTFTHLGEKKLGQLAYTCFIAHPNPIEFFGCGRKRDRCKLHGNGRIKLGRRIVSIEAIAAAEAQCIMVDHPSHLYITDDYVVTHNTAITGALAKIYGDIGFRTIIVVPSRDLITQSVKTYVELGLDTGQYSGKVKDTEHQVVVSTWQALKNMPALLLTFQVIIIDEAHGVRGATLASILVEHGSHIPVRIGCTGTLPKEPADYQMVFAAIGGPQIYEITAAELQKQKLLATVNINQILTKDSDNPRMDRFAEYDHEKQALVANVPRNKWIADFLVDLATADGNTMVLVSSISVGKKLQKMIGDDNSVFVYGKDKDKVRQDVYATFATRNNIIVIANVQIAAVGLSIDRIFNLVLLDIGKAFTRVVQAIGRSLRMAEDKTHAEVYDIGTNYSFGHAHAKKRATYYSEAMYPHKTTVVAYK